MPIYEIYPLFSDTFLVTWGTQFKNLIIERIKQISDKEIKYLEKEVVTSIFSYLKNMFENTEDKWDKHELNLALRLLQCPFMEKKLKGLSEIKEIIECVTGKDPAIRRRYRFLSAETLAKWIVKHKVLEIIIEDSHVELFKRISNLLIFLANLKQLVPEHIDLI